LPAACNSGPLSGWSSIVSASWRRHGGTVRIRKSAQRIHPVAIVAGRVFASMINGRADASIRFGEGLDDRLIQILHSLFP
jgi:hypothetical protein